MPTDNVPLENIDLERQDFSSLPRSRRDPFEQDANDSSDIETLNANRYSAQLNGTPYSNQNRASVSSLKNSDFRNDQTDGFINQPLTSDDRFGFAERSSMKDLPGRKHYKSKHHKSNSHQLGNRKSPTPPRLSRVILIVLLPISLVFCLLMIVHLTSPEESKNTSPVVAPTGLAYASGFNMKNNWGSLSPYFDTGVPFQGIDKGANSGLNQLPETCSLKQVHVLHRHAERYPTVGSGARMRETSVKLKNMTEPAAKPLDWLENWEYTLDVELLVPPGVGTEFQAGANFWASHGRLLFNATERGLFFYDPSLNVYPNGTERPPIVLRATDQSRIQTSARAWAAGFFGIYGDDPARSKDSDKKLKDEANLYRLVLQEEQNNRNSTLAGYYACPNANNMTYSPGFQDINIWINNYLKEAVIRLEKVLPGFQNMTAMDVFSMQNICAYETAAYDSSPFCGLFTEHEWRGYQYAFDIQFYGTASYGSAVGAPEGAGWVYELLARLEKRLIQPSEAAHGVNTTLTSSEDVFPTDQLFYMDMSHDSVIVSVLSALGLEFLKEDLPNNKLLAPRQFIVSRLTPFGARFFVEILECGEDSREQLVRLKLNNRILPLDGLKHCPEESKDGLCPLKDFIKSLKVALENVDFDTNCYGTPKGF